MMSRGRKKLVDDMLGGALNHNDTSNLEDIQSTTAEFTSNNYKDASMDDLGGEMMAGTSTSSSKLVFVSFVQVAIFLVLFCFSDDGL